MKFDTTCTIAHSIINFWKQPLLLKIHGQLISPLSDWETVLYSVSPDLYPLLGFLATLLVSLTVSLVPCSWLWSPRPVERLLLHPLVRYRVSMGIGSSSSSSEAREAAAADAAKMMMTSSAGGMGGGELIFRSIVF